MTMMRYNPLPIGRYWVDVFNADRPSFRGWLADHSATVHVEKQEDHLPVDSAADARTWYLFSVLAPTPWDGPGFPTVADENVSTSSDTADRPPPPPSVSDRAGEVLDSLDAAARNAGNMAKTVLAIAGLGAAAYFVSKLLD